MKLFCIVLVIYVLTLTLCGVEGRGGGGGGTRNGLEVSQQIEPIIILKDKLNSRSTFDYSNP